MRRDLGIALVCTALAMCSPAEVRVQAPPHGPAPESGVPTTAPAASRVPVDPRGRWPSEETPASPETAALFAEAAALRPPPVTPTPEPTGASEQVAWAHGYWAPWFKRIADLAFRVELAALRAQDEPDAVTLGALDGVLSLEVVDAMDRLPWPAEDEERRYVQEVHWDSRMEFALTSWRAQQRCIQTASPALAAWRRVCERLERELTRDPRAPPHLATFPVDCTFPPPGVPVSSRRPRAPITDIVVAAGVMPLLGAERVRVAEALAARISQLDPSRHYYAEGAAAAAPAGAPTLSFSCPFYDCSVITDGSSDGYRSARIQGPPEQLSTWLTAAASLHAEWHEPGETLPGWALPPPRAHSRITAIAGTGWPEADARAAIIPLLAGADACVVTAPNGPDVVGVVVEVSPDGRVQAEPTAISDRARCVADVFAAARLPRARGARRAALSIALGDPDAHTVQLRVARWDALRSRGLLLFHALAPCVAGLPADAVRAVRLRATVDAAGHATITSAEPFAPPADDALARCIADAYRHVVLDPGDPAEQLDDVVCVAHHVVDSDIERALYRP